MAFEIETKVLEVDVKAIRRRMDELGAKKILESRLIVDWFRTKGEKEGKELWYLRIRTNVSAGTHEVTWKGKSEVLGAARQHKEINFTVSDAQKTADFFEALDLEHYAHQEKDRISWVYKNFRFDLDQYPGMPAYMEIESDSEGSIQEAIRLLYLQNHATDNGGERILIQKRYSLDWYNMNF